ncbi:protein C15orf41 homolog [Trichonephila inaurata madagascariensis]|uniref:CDAN1-interacting nuclease 1 n=1 Tax=Trichonephila inaurata madagascariensis TaxID=2747483 RepID=A0A8X7CF38_9ARAC|nr:protein C15orf41 homolog [Trichonephila inaurata madagascariensis]
MAKYHEINKRDCIAELKAEFPDVPVGTLESIVGQERQRKTKKSYYYHAAPQNIAKYYRRYMTEIQSKDNKCGVLLQIADEVDLSPALMAKLILEYYYKMSSKENNLKEEESITKSKISEMLRNPALIQDKHLGAEIKLCTLTDCCYGPICDVLRNFSGLETENKLKNDLTKLGISFIDEKQLREKGYDKTPDVKLNVPIVFDGHIINWIESKASFGDVERHREYLRDQYWSYCNRFGPGLVIYWNGYIDELNNYKEQGIVISDSVPTEVSFMDPSVLMKKTYINKSIDFNNL